VERLRPSAEDLQQCGDLGSKVGEHLLSLQQVNVSPIYSSAYFTLDLWQRSKIESGWPRFTNRLSRHRKLQFQFAQVQAAGGTWGGPFPQKYL
jgi:hypothetical protein